jgi:hypothetical protein
VGHINKDLICVITFGLYTKFIEARGRNNQAFATHQGRLPQELAAAGITV